MRRFGFLLIGLAILIPATKAGFLVPKKSWDFPKKETWEKNWMGTISMESHIKISIHKPPPTIIRTNSIVKVSNLYHISLR